MRTLRHESGLIPSVLGEPAGLVIVTLSIVTFSQRSGWIVQLGERLNLRPSIKTSRQSANEIRRGRG